MLKGKKILLCVSGGIAVYKSIILTSKLVQAGAEVKVMMTESAVKFVNPISFQVLSQHEVYVDTFIETNPKVIAHIDAADWADIVVIAPATANTIGKIVNGIADNMLVTTILATTAPVWIAPAMNVDMYNNPIVQHNMKKAVEYGYHFVEPGEGFLACGQVGKGRMEEPEIIMAQLSDHFEEKSKLLENKTVLITAGPTREKIDPVRFFTNFSTGKMGYALASEAKKLGANVILVSGPTTIERPNGVTFIGVESASEMYDAVMDNFEHADIVIKSAAVADYRPKEIKKTKMKKEPGDLTLQLERTVDILAQLGKEKTKQFLVGFAAETDNMTENAQKKLEKKNVDIIVANDVTASDAGFGTDTNRVTIFKRDGTSLELETMSKNDVAHKILTEIFTHLKDE